MLWRRAFLEQHGGMQALHLITLRTQLQPSSCAALGSHVHLAQAPFEQPLGYRTFREVWKRQVRWARLRRVSFPHFFAPEIASSAALPALVALLAADLELDVACASALLVLIILYGMEAALA